LCWGFLPVHFACVRNYLLPHLYPSFPSPSSLLLQLVTLRPAS
jgi:hypothetical protein